MFLVPVAEPQTGSKVGIVIGAVIGAVVFAIIIAAIIIWFTKRSDKSINFLELLITIVTFISTFLT